MSKVKELVASNSTRLKQGRIGSIANVGLCSSGKGSRTDVSRIGLPHCANGIDKLGTAGINVNGSFGGVSARIRGRDSTERRIKRHLRNKCVIVGSQAMLVS